jgi:hypothetical protein
MAALAPIDFDHFLFPLAVKAVTKKFPVKAPPVEPAVKIVPLGATTTSENELVPVEVPFHTFLTPPASLMNTAKGNVDVDLDHPVITHSFPTREAPNAWCSLLFKSML